MHFAHHRKHLKALLLTTALALLLGGVWLWFILLSPWGFSLPPEETGSGAAVPHRVFVYGTLRLRPVRWIVIGRDVAVEPAALPGYRRRGLHVEPSPDDVVRGRVFYVDATELRRLDRYERLGVRYERVDKTLADGTRAWVYQRLDGR